MMKWSVLILFAYLGLCYAQLLEPVQIESAEKCKRIGGPGTFEKLQVAHTQTKSCLLQLIDIDTLLRGVSTNNKEASLNRVFGKYCAKLSEIKKCFDNEIEILRLCLTEEERKQLNIVTDIVNKIGDYACENSGENIVSFIEDKGIECLQTRIDSLAKCINQMSGFSQKPTLATMYLNMKTNEMSCRDYIKVKECIVHDLSDHCPNSTPAKTLDSVLTIIKNDLCMSNNIIRSKRSLRRKVRDALYGHSSKLPHIEETLKRSCHTNFSNENELDDKLEIMKACVGKKEIFIDSKQTYINNMKNCSKDIIDTLENCLPEKFKYLPKLLFQIIESIIGFFYDDYWLIAKVSSSCNLDNEESEKKVNDCMEKKGGNDIPETKEKFCTQFVSMTKCVTNEIREKCKQGYSTNKLANDYDLAMKRPCE